MCSLTKMNFSEWRETVGTLDSFQWKFRLWNLSDCQTVWQCWSIKLLCLNVSIQVLGLSTRMTQSAFKWLAAYCLHFNGIARTESASNTRPENRRCICLQPKRYTFPMSWIDKSILNSVRYWITRNQCLATNSAWSIHRLMTLTGTDWHLGFVKLFEQACLQRTMTNTGKTNAHRHKRVIAKRWPGNGNSLRVPNRLQIVWHG